MVKAYQLRSGNRRCACGSNRRRAARKQTFRLAAACACNAVLVFHQTKCTPKPIAKVWHKVSLVVCKQLIGKPQLVSKLVNRNAIACKRWLCRHITSALCNNRSRHAGVFNWHLHRIQIGCNNHCAICANNAHLIALGNNGCVQTLWH